MRSGFVSIIGRSNVGKSTLLNRFAGEKIAAVSPKPQTTRNRITGIRTTKKGQIVFVDTPGIHKPFNKMHKRMVETAMGALDGMDAVLLIVDSSAEFGTGDQFVLNTLRTVGVPRVLALNKVDLIKKRRLLPLMARYQEEKMFEAMVPISALHGDGINSLEDELFTVLPEGEPLFPEDAVTDQPERTLAAEIIREKVFLLTEKEIPYSSAVLIDSFEEKPDRLDIIASILVERRSQKGIVIGRGGGMLKRIGTEARKELEKLLNIHIYIELWVKVRERWREDDRFLRDLGL